MLAKEMFLFTLILVCSSQPSMEDILSRFIHIGEQIFEKLDSESLVKCRTVAKSWKIFISNGKDLPICIMNAHTNIEKTKLWKTYKKCPTEKVARIAIDVEKVYKELKKPLGGYLKDRRFWRKKKWCYLGKGSPMHIAIREEYFDVFQLILNNTNEKNPTDINGDTALHAVAEKGLSEVCNMIMEHLDDKNPKSINLERTPLHKAASGGHLQTCELIMKYLDDKNPSDYFGKTPLHMAARYGQFEACQLFIQNVTNKNPKDRWGKTPLHEAADSGHYEIYCMIMANVTDKNPRNDCQKTLLHLAAEGGYYDLCQMIIENVQEKNPRAHVQLTPLHMAAIYGHYDICKLIIENVDEKNPKDIHGRTPMDLAAKNGHKSVCQLFQEGMSFFQIFRSNLKCNYHNLRPYSTLSKIQYERRKTKPVTMKTNFIHT